MKTLFQIILRYALSAVGVLLLLIAVNITALVGYTIKAMHSDFSPLEYRLRDFAETLTHTETGWELPEDSMQDLQQNYVWGMLLDPQGEVVWSDRLPPALNHRYSPAQVAAFSRWYLADYPVYAYQKGDFLLVLANPKNSRWKYPVEMDIRTLNSLLQQFPIWVMCNLLLAILLILLSSIRFFRSIRRIAGGLSDLAKENPVSLPEKGIFKSLCHDLNTTSVNLRKQQELLNRRDRMRTEWIAGVSHDVRTPLTIILGTAAQMENDPENTPARTKKAQTIRIQGERLRRLIEDLNLASKLTYNAQPLRKKMVILPVLIRQIVTDLLNQHETLALSLTISHDCEGVPICIDEALIERAIRNLIGNSMAHTPPDTNIFLNLQNKGQYFAFSICDTGAGYPAAVLESLNRPLANELPSHGLGLPIVRQIAELHGGTTTFFNSAQGACCIVTLPIFET
ncbi:MAG: HAMP domain-containing sensor histidine kinase [Butyricicoccus pullicaecorum]|nr:HAMP domain-containing sensor histidine kinase [Butyricicoccus pullicaecorum]